VSELAKLYRTMAQERRETATRFCLWPDEARELMRQALELEAKADQADGERPAE
jgi:hypothetical protein